MGRKSLSATARPTQSSVAHHSKQNCPYPISCKDLCNVSVWYLRLQSHAHTLLYKTQDGTLPGVGRNRESHFLLKDTCYEPLPPWFVYLRNLQIQIIKIYHLLDYERYQQNQ